MTDLENPLTSMRRAIAFDSRDWAADRRDAWLYGIVCGWSDESLDGFVDRGFWDADESRRLRRLHQGFTAQLPAEQLSDPRPSDMAELAMLVAVELRSRAIPSAHCAHNWPVVYVVRLYGSYADPQTMLSPYTLTNSAFDNLGPVAIATEIQQYEAQYLQEWAGNK